MDQLTKIEDISSSFSLKSYVSGDVKAYRIGSIVQLFFSIKLSSSFPRTSNDNFLDITNPLYWPKGFVDATMVYGYTSAVGSLCYLRINQWGYGTLRVPSIDTSATMRGSVMYILQNDYMAR